MSSDVIITVEKLSKLYRLGEICATSLRESVERWGQGIKKYFSPTDKHRLTRIDKEQEISKMSLPPPADQAAPDKSNSSVSICGQTSSSSRSAAQTTPACPADMCRRNF